MSSETKLCHHVIIITMVGHPVTRWR